MRFALAGSIAAFLIAGIVILILVSIEAAIRLEALPLSNLERNASSEAAQETADRATLSDAAKILTAMASYDATSSPALEAIAALVGDRTAGVTLTSISYNSGSKSIQLAGSGPAGAARAYSDALKADTHFESVQVPVGALVSDARQFTITLTGNF